MSDISILFDSETDENEFGGFSDGTFKVNSKKPEDKTVKAIKVIMAILIVFGILEFGFYNFIRPCLNYPKVSVDGNLNYTSSEIVEMLRPMNARNWFGFSVESAASIISSASGIDSVSVRKNHEFL